MATTPVVVGQGNVEGTLSNCTINSQTVFVDSWHDRVFGVNSCTGEVVSDHTYFQWGYIYTPSIIIGGILLVCIGLMVAHRVLFD